MKELVVQTFKVSNSFHCSRCPNLFINITDQTRRHRGRQIGELYRAALHCLRKLQVKPWGQGVSSAVSFLRTYISMVTKSKGVARSVQDEWRGEHFKVLNYFKANQSHSWTIHRQPWWETTKGLDRFITLTLLLKSTMVLSCSRDIRANAMLLYNIFYLTEFASQRITKSVNVPYYLRFGFRFIEHLKSNPLFGHIDRKSVV